MIMMQLPHSIHCSIISSVSFWQNMHFGESWQTNVQSNQIIIKDICGTTLSDYQTKPQLPWFFDKKQFSPNAMTHLEPDFNTQWHVLATLEGSTTAIRSPANSWLYPRDIPWYPYYPTMFPGSIQLILLLVGKKKTSYSHQLLGFH